MELPKGKPTKRQEKQIVEVRSGIAKFAEMFELATRLQAVGIDVDQRCALIGYTRFNAPTAETITEEQFKTLRDAAEKAEASRG
jgi:glycerol dehydrogenase-like iron-containing ADH family enzyme